MAVDDKRQFWALLRKNWLIKKRVPVSSLMEIILPTLVLVILVILRHFSNHTEYHADLHVESTTHYNTTEMTALMLGQMNYTGGIIAFIPRQDFPELDAYFTAIDMNPSTREVFFNLPENTFIRGFEDEDEMKQYINHPEYGHVERPLIHAAVVSSTKSKKVTTPQQLLSSLDDEEFISFGNDNVLFNADGDHQYKYTLRFNASNDVAVPSYQTIPDTRLAPVDLLQPGFEVEKWTRYAYNGFWLMQQLQDMFILNRTGAVFVPSYAMFLPDEMDKYIQFTVQPFPTPDYSADLFLRSMGDNIGLFFTLTFIWSVTRIVSALVEEKELKLAEGMKIMGLKSKWLILSWLATYLVIFIASAAVLAGTVGLLLFGYSSPFVVFLFFLAFCLSVFSFGFVMSTIFTKSSVASTFSAIIFLCIFFPYYMVNGPGVSRGALLLSSLLSPPIALALGATSLANLEQGLIGAHFGTLFKQYNGYAIGDAIFILFFDAIFLFILGLYLDQVIPGEYGVKKPWHFPWSEYIYGKYFKKQGNVAPVTERSSLLSNNNNSVYDEQPSEGNEDYTKYEQPAADQLGNEMLRIRHLRKEFPSASGEPFVAVKDLSVDFYKGEIVGLLGHNGAGKTTTMNMLTGMLPVTSGNVQMMGKDLKTDLNEIRQNLGYCPQHDLLYPTLTVREHLELYCDIKGATTDPELRNQMVLDMIHEVGLDKDNKEHSQAKDLSGGQKRKLSVAIAFLNNSQLVFLDEASSGMDVHACRDLWNVCQKNKKGRLIVITTHNLEEAEAIGDRIAVMAHSRLQCIGTSRYLKENYGVGYTLTITKQSKKEQEQQQQQNQNQQNKQEQLKLHPSCTTISGSIIARYLSKYNFLTISGDAGLEISYKMPFSASKEFPQLFDDLDQNGPMNGILSYSMSVTTLTEVFLAIGHGASTVEGIHDIDRTTTVADDMSDDDDDDDDGSLVDSTNQDPQNILPASLFGNNNNSLNSDGGGVSLQSSSTFGGNGRGMKNGKPYWTLNQVFKNHNASQVSTRELYTTHIKALIIKRWNNLKRDRKALLWQMVYPILILIAALFVTKLNNVDEYPIRHMSAGDLYNDEYGGYVPYTQINSDVDVLMNTIKRDLASHLIPVSLDKIPINDTLSHPIDSSQLLTNIHFATLFDAYQMNSNMMNTVLQTPANIYSLWEQNIVNQKQQQQEQQKEVDDDLLLIQKQFSSEQHADINNLIESMINTPSLSNDNKQQKLTLEERIVKINEFQQYLLNSINQTKDARQIAFNINQFNPINPEQPPVGDKPIFSGSLHFNTTAQDALPAGVNMLSNALLRYHFKQQFQRQYGYSIDDNQIKINNNLTAPTLPSIELINNPLPRTKNEKLFVSSTTALFIGLAFSFVPATFVSYIVKERADKFKHLQFIAGVTPLSYWFSTYLWDTLNFIGPFVAAIFCLIIFDVQSLIRPSAFFLTCLAFWLFQLSIAPFSYLCSFFFTSPSAAQNLTLLANFFLSVILLMTSLIMSVLPSTEKTDHVLRFLYRLFPSFSFGEALITISLHDATFVETGDLYWPFIYMFFEAIIYFWLLLIVEDCIVNNTLQHYKYMFLRTFCCGKASLGETNIPIDYNVEEDDDVIAERERIQRGEALPEEHALILNGLRKVYPSTDTRPPFVAVNNLFLALKYGECLSLLGANGAGKTSTMKVLTTEENPSPGSGDILFAGLSLQKQSTQVKQLIGYCPQFSSYIPLVSGREHLELFCKLKCVPSKYIPGLCNHLIEKLGMQHLADRPVGGYSGGTQRRLSVGLSLIGSKILLLDEPSSGVDASSRREIWRIIQSTKKHRSTILISHSMEECIALSDRIAIMCSGNIRALNTPSQLQYKYGDGYQFVVRCKEGYNKEMINWFQTTFDNMEIVEQHGINFALKIPKKQPRYQQNSNQDRMTFRQVFTILEDYRASSQSTIQTYSIGDTDLEHIFCDFVEKDTRRKQALFAQQRLQAQGLQIPQEQQQSNDLYLLGSPGVDGRGGVTTPHDDDLLF